MWLEEEAEECENWELKGPVVFCMQAEHTGTKTYYFSTDSHEDQEEWIRAMSEASDVNVQPKQRCKHKDIHRSILDLRYAYIGNHILVHLIWPVQYDQSQHFMGLYVLFVLLGFV